MTPKQTRFVAEYLIDLNATQAAIRAGYSAKSAEFQGSKLLANGMVSQEIAKGKGAQLDRADLTAARVLEELRRLAFSDMGALYDPEGRIKPLQDMTPEARACLAGVETIRKNTAAGDGIIDTVDKIKVYDKTKALDLLAKHFGLLIDKVDHSGELTIKWQD